MDLLRVIAALVLIVGLLLVAIWLLKRRRTTTDNMSLLRYYPLGPRRGVAALKVYDEVLVLGVTNQNIQLLKSFPADKIPEEPEGAGESSLDFRAILGRLK